ncbi:serine protease [Lactococcus garvieae]|uniref:serine protease n=1 Tax=Lactococcus garvieae TaxID=1363 RepID=UPI002551973A|nr:serine protease [Lactococcus garvieae]
MKFTKKQWIIGSIVALVLAGGGTALVVNHQAQVRADKIAQEEKAAYDKLVKAAQEATKKAETFKAEADVKSAQDAIKKLEEKDKGDLIARVEKVRQNWDLVNKAEKNVVNAEKAKSDATVKTAQAAINQLKAEMTKAKKTALQKRLDKVKAEIKAKKDKATAEKKAQEAAAQQKAQDPQAVAQNNRAQASSGNAGVAQAETPTSNGAAAYNGYAQTPVQDNTGYVAPTPSGGNVQTPAQPSTAGTSQPSAGVNRPAGGTSNNNSAPAPAPAVTYTGWVRNEAGQIIWSQGGYKTLDEASRAAAQWANAHVWESGSYGAY